MVDYPDEQSAARGLLGEIARLLSAQGVDFVVIGGWLPYLFNNHPISHPGTFDVDILLNESTPKAAFEAAADHALKLGYLRAPKNQFQLHRLLTVRGEQFVYHVDFLHRKYADDTDDLIRNWGKFQSIAGPGTDIIFTERERTVESICIRLPTGESVSLPVPFCSEVGFLSAKGRSALTPKRTRDAFDIFLVIRQSRDYARLVERSRTLVSNGVFRQSLENLRGGFSEGRLCAQAVAHLREQSPNLAAPGPEVRSAIDMFFDAVLGANADQPAG